MSDAAHNVKSIFGQAMELDAPDERAAFLDRTCGVDSPLRKEVDGLLHALDKAGQFMVGTPGPSTIDEPGITERPGARIGPYKLMEQIGEGGFGLVFVAEQQEPVRRKVALKVIKPGMDSAQVMNRFSAERQALALMDHPNIARVLDAGATDTGRPYFVMELVRGIPITEYCDQNQLAPRERLDLFVTVCQAIQHAHQKGIIHRDIKPSNVLVTSHDGKPVAKVIDFGVAKAISQQLTERTIYTNFAQMIGTPLYMSPEQAEMSGLDIDTRSDVYSLGVLLYELLTGTTPLQRKQIATAAYDEIRRMIREEEPPKPSTRLSQATESKPSVAAQRKMEPAKLSRLMRGDLDWITMKALEKDRTRRYETASGLARDIERYLADEAVEACPPSAGYKLRKFARKYRAALATAATIGLLLTAGVAVSTWQAVRASQAERAAQIERVAADIARQEAQDNEQAARRAAQAEAEQRKLAEQERDARQAALKRSDGLRLTAQSTIALETNPGLALLLAIEGAERGPRVALHNNALLAALDRCHEDRAFRCGHPVQFATIVPASKYVLIPGGYRVSELDANHAAAELLHLETGAVRKVAVGPHRSIHTATVSRDGRLVVFTHIGGYSEVRFQSGAAFRYTDHIATICDLTTGKVVVVLKGHKDRVVSAAFSPDGRRVVTASYDQTTRIWDSETGAQLVSIPNAECSAMSAEFLPDGKRVCTVAYGCTFQFARSEASNPKIIVDPPAGTIMQGTGPNDLLVGTSSSGAGGSINSVGIRFIAHIWDAQTGKEVAAMPLPPRSFFSREDFGRVQCSALSPDGERLLVAGRVADRAYPDRRAAIWSVATGRLLFTLPMIDEVEQAAFSPDGDNLLTVHRSGRVRVFDAADGQSVALLDGPAGPINSARFSPDGLQVVITSDDRTARVWGAATGRLVAIFRGHEDKVNSAAFTADGNRVVTASTDGAVRVWVTSPDRTYAQSLVGHETEVNAIEYSPDGRRLVTASNDRTARVWDAASAKQLALLRPNLQPFRAFPRGMQDDLAGPVNMAAFHPDGQRVLTTSRDSIATVRVLKGGLQKPSPPAQMIRSIAMPLSLPFRALALVAAAGASPLPLARADGEFESEKVHFTPTRIWDAELGRELAGIPGHQSEIVQAAWSRDGKLFLTAEGANSQFANVDLLSGVPVRYGSGSQSKGDGDAAVRIYDAATNRQLAAIPHKGSIVSAAFSPDGARVVTVCQARSGPSTRIWEARTGKELLVLGNDARSTWEHYAMWAVFSRDGKRVLMTGHSSRAAIWDAKTGALLASLNGVSMWSSTQGYDLGFQFDACSPDGRRFALPIFQPGRADSVVGIFDFATGRKIVELSGHRHRVHSAVFSSDSRLIVTAGGDETARIWDAETGAELMTITGHKGPVRFATFSPDGRSVATAGADGRARVTQIDLLPIAKARKPRELTADERRRFGVGE